MIINSLFLMEYKYILHIFRLFLLFFLFFLFKNWSAISFVRVKAWFFKSFINCTLNLNSFVCDNGTASWIFLFHLFVPWKCSISYFSPDILFDSAIKVYEKHFYWFFSRVFLPAFLSTSMSYCFECFLYCIIIRKMHIVLIRIEMLTQF